MSRLGSGARISTRIVRLTCVLACLWEASAAGGATVDLVPDERASWRPSVLFAWLRPQHNFGARTLSVETTPPGAELALFYIRANFQKRYERARAPALVALPRRVEAGPRDAVTIRAFLEGYREREVSVRVASGQEHVLIELEPLPNELVAVSHTYFGGRASLAFLTRESLSVDVQRVQEGFQLILAETAQGPGVGGALEGVRGPLIEKVEAHQLGEDLLVRVQEEGRDGSLELRSRSSHDPLRDLYVFSVDLVPAGDAGEAVRRAREALERLGREQIADCAAVFDEALRRALDPAALARALAPRGVFTDPYLRAAMRRLGELSPEGRIELESGARFDPGNAIELEAALGQASEAQGFLALLRAFVRELEPRDSVAGSLRGLVAPEASPDDWAAALAGAEAAEQRCRRP